MVYWGKLDCALCALGRRARTLQWVDWPVSPVGRERSGGVEDEPGEVGRIQVARVRWFFQLIRSVEK